jgi:predicted RNA-binding Zn-ribbon protein involved in translation (DUF1610 family)
MPPTLCPACTSVGSVLELSFVSWVWYLRCPSCGHVWTVSKDRQQAIGRVTDPPCARQHARP